MWNAGFAPTFYLGCKQLMNHSIEELVREIAIRASSDNGLEFVHTEIAGGSKNLVIRIFIDKKGGVTHEDCALISRRIGDELDVQDSVALSYTLEVSSPGLERGLYSLEDFERFAGQPARVKIKNPIDGQKNFRGRITGIKGQNIIFDDKTNGSVSFPHIAVVKANLEIDLEEELKRNS